MTEREMLEMAARACGINAVWCSLGTMLLPDTKTNSGCDEWNPLINDGDCARMESALRIFVSWSDRIVQCSVFACDICEEQFLRDHGGDRMAARRMASFKVAAAIGKAMT